MQQTWKSCETKCVFAKNWHKKTYQTVHDEKQSSRLSCVQSTRAALLKNDLLRKHIKKMDWKKTAKEILYKEKMIKIRKKEDCIQKTRNNNKEIIIRGKKKMPIKSKIKCILNLIVKCIFHFAFLLRLNFSVLQLQWLYFNIS